MRIKFSGSIKVKFTILFEEFEKFDSVFQTFNNTNRIVWVKCKKLVEK